ncbi:hypothetical protein [Ralstonia phage RP31]|uniref:Uncharacterized protein n=1 Tax=Ralstonia phage RP31 TaxID=1923890 RepID=A0A1L7N240_9CAUD|nr:hypothetical protein [Ralstonia phage RP31]
MSDFNNNQQQRPKTVLNHRALTLYAPNGEGKFANMSFDIKKNDPIITVRTNVANDANNDYGRIQANVPYDKFTMFLEMIRHAALTDQPFRWAYEHRDKKFIGPGKMTDGPVLIYRLVVGREENGVVYISVVMDKRPNIKFSFLADTKTLFKDGDGNEMPKHIESKFLALGKVKAIEDLMPLLMKEQYKHPEPKQQGGGGGNWGNRNGGNGGGGNGGGYQNNRSQGSGNADMGSDDIPW